jgi:hypothetical protein
VYRRLTLAIADLDVYTLVHLQEGGISIALELLQARVANTGVSVMEK